MNPNASLGAAIFEKIHLFSRDMMVYFHTSMHKVLISPGLFLCDLEVKVKASDSRAVRMGLKSLRNSINNYITPPTQVKLIPSE